MIDTIKSYCPSLPSIDWQKSVKQTLLPRAASLGVGTIANFDTPTAYAISYVTRQVLSNPLAFCLRKLYVAGENAYDHIDPNSEMFPGANKLKAIAGYSAMAAAPLLYFTLPFVAAYQVCEMTGYPIDPYSMVLGSITGGMVHHIVQARLQEDPFANEEGVLSINKDNFQKEVLEADLPVVIDAYATWCPPCKMMAPIFSEISKELSGKVKFVKFNVDENRELAQTLNVNSMPTFLFYKEGKLANTHSGAMGKEAFKHLCLNNS